jgi:hypothetical protein
VSPGGAGDSNPNRILITRNLLILLGDVTDARDVREGVCTNPYNLFAPRRRFARGDANCYFFSLSEIGLASVISMGAGNVFDSASISRDN